MSNVGDGFKMVEFESIKEFRAWQESVFGENPDIDWGVAKLDKSIEWALWNIDSEVGPMIRGMQKRLKEFGMEATVELKLSTTDE